MPHITAIKNQPCLHQTRKREKRAYNERIMQEEYLPFTPIVTSTTGGMGTEASRFHKRLATLIADKRNESYADVLNFTRMKLRFSLLKSTVIAIRCILFIANTINAAPISSLSFNLIAIEDE